MMITFPFMVLLKIKDSVNWGRSVLLSMNRGHLFWSLILFCWATVGHLFPLADRELN